MATEIVVMLLGLMVVMVRLILDLAVILQHQSTAVLVLSLRMQHLQLVVVLANLDRILDVVLVLFLDVHWHGMVVMHFEALM